MMTFARKFAVSLALVCVIAHSAPAPQPDGPNGSISVTRHDPSSSVLQYRKSLRKDRPPLRGFRAPILRQAADPWPFDFPGADAPENLRLAADTVGRRLAKDGLLVTLAAALRTLRPMEFPVDDHAVEELLRTVGIPVDLLGCFASDADPGSLIEIVRDLHRRLISGRTVDDLRAELAAIPFRFRKSRPDFRVAVETGEHAIGTIRLQLPTVKYWRGAGDGCSLDIARQLVNALPDADFVISVQQPDLDKLLESTSTWRISNPSRLTVIAESLPVSQWAQDNGKPGLVGPPNDSRIATLVPRFASIGEDGSKFVPNESFLADGLVAAGHTVIQSPLIFQGGNLIPVHDPATGERIMLVGEAEVYRNTALGLTREQVVEAFKTEFAVDRCVILPAVSFHIDFEVCVRAHNGKLVAFVNDEPAAAKRILASGINALVSHGGLNDVDADHARRMLSAGELENLLPIIGPPIGRARNPTGYFPNSLAEHFAGGPRDSGAANLQRFMLAMDIVTASIMPPDALPTDRFARAFMQSLQRRESDRRRLHEQLAAFGWTVVPVPSLADEDRSINYLNGLHDAETYLMPAYGGLYAGLDQAAAAAFKKALGPQITVTPVLCGESQRRLGALHCAAACYPRP